VPWICVGAGGGGGGSNHLDGILYYTRANKYHRDFAFRNRKKQQMTGPTGLVFAMRSRYASPGVQNGPEAFYNEASTGFAARGGSNTSATNAGYSAANTVGGQAQNVDQSATVTGIPGVANNVGANTYAFAGGFNRNTLEGLGSNTPDDYSLSNPNRSRHRTER
jgi:hypothetical protein